MNLSVGNMVSWSTRGPTSHIRIGKIIEVVPPRGTPAPNYHSTHLMKSIGFGQPRDHISYIVSVKAQNPKSKPMLYWPRVEALTLVMDTTGPDALKSTLVAQGL